jgi:hypothetical protein
MTDNETLLATVDDVVEVLRAGLQVGPNTTDDPEVLEQVERDDKEFYAAARIFIDELRRQSDKRAAGEAELALARCSSSWSGVTTAGRAITRPRSASRLGSSNGTAPSRRRRREELGEQRGDPHTPTVRVRVGGSRYRRTRQAHGLLRLGLGLSDAPGF